MENQYKGTDISTGKLTYYKVDDQTNVITAKYDEASGQWLLASDIGVIPKPEDLVPALTTSDIEDLKTELSESGLFKPKTDYIIIGDEPQGGAGVIDLKSMLGANDVADLKKFLMFFPRQMLFEFFMQKIYPTLPWDFYSKAEDGRPSNIPQTKDPIYGTYYYKKAYQDMIWASFIDLFNEANLEYVNQNKIEPWTWEQKKLDAYYVSQSDQALTAVAQNIESFRDVSLAVDERAKSIMEQYLELPKLGDVGLEINRQNSIKELLKMREYETAQAIIDAFRYAGQTVIGEALTKPIPYDIVAKDGSGVVKASQ